MAIASLLVRIGAQDQEIQNALASIGQKAKSVDADLKKLGQSPLASQAIKSFDTMKSAMDEITKAQQRLAERAKLAATGLEAMGGAGKLTESQLKAVNRTLQQGMSAYEALGERAPAELQRVADAVKDKLDKPVGDLNARMIALGTTIGNVFADVAMNVGRALIASGKAAFDYAGKLTDLRAQTDVSVEGLQRMEAIGAKGGVSLDELAKSVSSLQKNLDSTAGRDALADMGMSFEQIRKLKPEQQWFEIAQAVAATEDPIERMNRGTALFRGSWTQIAPALEGDIEEITRNLKTLSTEHAEALDEAGEAWAKFKKDADIAIAGYLGRLVMAANDAKLAWVDLLNPLNAARKLAQGGENVAADWQKNLPKIEAPALFGGGGPRPPLNLNDAEEVLAILEKSDKALEASIERGEKFKAIQDQLFGRTLIANVNDTVKALGSVENLQKLTAASAKKLHDDVGAAIEVYRRLGQQVPPILQDIYDRTIPLKTFEIKPVIGPGLQGLTQTFIEFGDVMQDGTIYAEDFSRELNAGQIQTDKYGNVVKTQLITPIKASTIEMKKAATVAEDMRKSLRETFSGIPELFRDAFTGGGGFLGAMKALGVQIADALLAPLMSRLGGLAGKFADAITGGLKGSKGAVAGAVGGVAGEAGGAGGGGLGGLFGGGIGVGGGLALAGIGGAVAGLIVGLNKLKAQRAHMEVNRLREAFFELEGGLESLNPRVLEITGNLDAVQKVFDARNPQEYQVALNELNAILEIGKQRFTALQTGISEVGGKLSELTVLTPEIEGALAAVFDQSNTEGYLAAVTELNRQLDEQAGKYNTVRDTLDKYGIAFKDAGKQFQQSNINKRAQELVTDFKNLKSVSVDANAIMRGMGKSLNDFIKDAQTAGVEVPEAMREVIQVGIDAGQVFDKDGKAIKNMNELGLTFGTTMETTMKTVATSVDRLGLVLEGLAKFLGITLPKAAKDGAEDVNDALDDIKSPVIKPRFEWPKDFPETPSAPPPEFAQGSGGIRDFGSGTLAVLHGREAVVTEADLKRGTLAAAVPPPVVVHMTINVDGVFSEGDLVQTVQRHIEPIVRQTWEDNVNGARTNAQDILGVP